MSSSANNPFKDFLARIASRAADDNGLPKDKTGEEIESTFTISELKNIKSFFRDEHAGRKVFFAGIISMIITGTGAFLVIAPPSNVPQACKDNGPSILAAGVSLLGGFFIGKF